MLSLLAHQRYKKSVRNNGRNIFFSKIDQEKNFAHKSFIPLTSPSPQKSKRTDPNTNFVSTVMVEPSINIPGKSKTVHLTNKKHVDINIGDNVTIVDEATLSIQCPISGIPTPDVTWWFKDGQKLNASRYIDIHENFTLTIRRAKPGDSGRYKCVAQSIAGENSETSDVTVVGKDRKTHFFNNYIGVTLLLMISKLNLLLTNIQGSN